MKTTIPAAAPRLLLPAAIAAAIVFSIMAAGRMSAGGITTVGLGTAEPFAVLAGTPSVSNVGLTEITGNLGIHPASSVTGFPPGIVNGTIHAGDAVALQAKTGLVNAYNDAAGRTPATAVAGGLLGGQTLVAGVYNSGSFTLNLTGTLTLNGQNDPNSVWIFQATSDLVTASTSVVTFINGGSPCNVFWQVDSSATLGSGSTFIGTIMALSSITMADDVTISGRALARDGNVTLINDTISNSMCVTVPPGPTPTPTPAPAATPTPLLPNTSSAQGGGVPGHPPVLILFGASAALIAGTVMVLRRSAVRTGRQLYPSATTTGALIDRQRSRQPAGLDGRTFERVRMAQ